ncbi:MAG: hypothetical protein IIA59_11530 [Candidatus Marinimicrobia bacterium]|nr:hypothetical protein [Candidatus Neomarinimicrobiota bacterium]
MQLSPFASDKFFFGHSAVLGNEGIPNFILTGLKLRFPDLPTKTVGIPGMAFIAEIDDTRESLSYKLKWLCEVTAAKVFCSDPHIEVDDWVSPEVLIDRCDIVNICAPTIPPETCAHCSKVDSFIHLWVLLIILGFGSGRM